jgi:hypothetical protein
LKTITLPDHPGMKFLAEKYKGKGFMVGYDDRDFPEVKKYAQQKLRAEVDRFKEQLRIVELGFDKYLDEVYQHHVAECPHCHSLDTVERRDRVMPYQFLGRIGNLVNGIWHVEPYRRCNACGNDFEEQLITKDDLRKMVRSRFEHAVSETTLPAEAKI